MNRIKKFIKDNKEEMKVLAYGTAMLVVGIYIGKKYKGIKYECMLDNLARTGKTVNNFVDGKEYMLSITEVKEMSLT